MENSKNLQTKFFALQILESLVKYRWGALPEDQQEGLKNYVSNLIVSIASNAEEFHRQRLLMSKLNVVLVGILKHSWPHKWESFITEMVQASKTSETLCENSMEVFKLLSEEVFDFSRGEMTGAKTRELKMSLNNEFQSIQQLCSFVLNSSTNPSLIRATLDALHVYLSWVPIAFIFQGNLVDCLLRLFPQEPFRNVALKCLIEIGSLSVEEFGAQFVVFYKMFLHSLEPIMSLQVDVKEAYENGSDDVQECVLNLAEFFATFLRTHHMLLESRDEDRMVLITGLQYLVNISYVDNLEVFKTCLEFWNYFVVDIFSFDSQMNSFPANNNSTGGGSKNQIFKEILSQVRAVMISRMAKPEEVIIVEDENGNIVRETLADSDTLQQYKTMRETLIYLSNLDQQDTETQMVASMKIQMKTAYGGDHNSFHWAPLNTLCWAIGSISGTMDEEQESKFLVGVIRDLLSLCEHTRGKDNKAIIASNIMWVVGQYPRFLRAHWKFLKTVVNKLFEFMHETHPGVQDMACDTFLKICSKCKTQFVIHQKDETMKFVFELLHSLDTIISDLSPTQISTFYESVGMMISAEHIQPEKELYLEMLMRPPNEIWQQLISSATNDLEVLKLQENIRRLQHCLQANTAVCKSLGRDFTPQMKIMFRPMLQVYRKYSELISTAIQTGGPHAARSSSVKAMRSVKRAALQLLEIYVETAQSPDLIAKELVPEMIDPILGDYNRNVPDARDSEVLSLFAMIIRKVGSEMETEVHRVFESVFECTLAMITRNFEDYPEHRLKFFNLLQAITTSCFPVIFAMSPPQVSLIMDSIIWACRHTERNVAEIGLSLLEDLIYKFTQSEIITQFYQSYYTKIITEVFSIMTDTFHKPGFKLQSKILHMLFTTVQNGEMINGPIWDVAEKGQNAFPNNAAFVGRFVFDLLQSSFPNMTSNQIEVCIAGMFDIKEFQKFKHHLRDFLVQTKQFATQDNAELFAEEVARTRMEEQAKFQSIPGMLPPC